MANWSNPTLTSLYTDFVTEVKNRDVDLALGLDPATTSPTNVPTNAIRWNSASYKYEKWNGTAWGDLSSKYIFTAVEVSGATVPANGMYLSATNTLNFATATTASRLTIDASGNVNIDAGTFYVDAVNNRVGVGTANPGTAFHIGGSPAGQTIRINSSTSAGFVGVGGYITQIAANRNPVDGAIVNTGTATAYINLEADISNGNIQFCTTNLNNSGAVERMRLDAFGNLGLGVTPSAWGFGKAIQAGTSTNLWDDAGGAVYLTNNGYFNGSNWIYRNTSFASNYRQVSGAHIWSTAPSGTAGAAISFTQAMTLDASGNLGLGTTVLDLVGSTTSLTLDKTSGNGQLSLAANGTVRGRIFADNASSELRIGNPTANPVTFFTANTERVRITSGGLVGIGTTSVSSLLHLASSGPVLTLQRSDSASPGAAINFTNNTSGVNWQIGTNQAVGGSAFEINSGNQTNNRFVITSAGLVGVGTTNPAYTLDVASSVLQVGNSTDAFVQYKSTAGNWHVGANSSNAYVFYSGTYGSGSERCRIDSSGRLLVGTPSARSNLYNSTNTARFQVEGADNDGAAVAIVQNFNSNTLGGQLILAKSNSTSLGSNTLVASGDRCGTISFQGNDGTQFVEAALIRAEIDGTPGADDMPGRLVFSTTADGAASPTERLRIDNAGYMQGNVNGLSAGRIPAKQYYRLNTARTGTITTTAQSIFGVGVTLVGSTVYEFEGIYHLSGAYVTSPSSCELHFLFGGTATLNNIMYMGAGPGLIEEATYVNSYSTNADGFYSSVATSVKVVDVVATNVSVTYFIKGTVSVNAAGTFIPQYRLTQAPTTAFTTRIGSYFSIWPLGASGANTSIGSWA